MLFLGILLNCSSLLFWYLDLYFEILHNLVWACSIVMSTVRLSCPFLWVHTWFFLIFFGFVHGLPFSVYVQRQKKSYLVWRQSYHSKLKVPGLLSVVGKLSQSQKLTSWSHHQSFSSLIGNRGVCPTRFHIIFHSPSLYTCTWKWMLQYT